MEGETRNTLPKTERLCGKTAISKLLAKGRHGSVQGLRYLCLYDSSADISRVMVSVPKKSFKRAVRRNLLKRRIRESWRRQKHALCVKGGIDLLLMYSAKEVLSYEDIYAAVGKVIDTLNARYDRRECPSGQAEAVSAPATEQSAE